MAENADKLNAEVALRRIQLRAKVDHLIDRVETDLRLVAMAVTDTLDAYRASIAGLGRAPFFRRGVDEPVSPAPLQARRDIEPATTYGKARQPGVAEEIPADDLAETTGRDLKQAA